jgi:hypothetical protein
MNVEIGTEAALFPEKEYISGIFLAVRQQHKEKHFGIIRAVCVTNNSKMAQN